jgi:hypothetical protein
MKNEVKAIASSLFRLSLTAMIGVIIAHGGIYGINWKEVVGAGGFAAAMVLYNYFNLDNKNYGKGAENHEK